MATDLESRSAASKYDAFVDKQLTQVQSRIRRLDVLRSVLWLGVVVLGYGLSIALFDLLFQGLPASLTDAVHLISFLAFAGVVLVLIGQLVVRVYRRINPYYAAKQLEETIPEAKNSVINYLDLKEEKLPKPIRGALSQKAARDLKHTDSEKAVNPRSNWLLFSVLAGLVLGFLILLAVRPNQIASLMQRAYAPFNLISIDSRTQITLLQPDPEKGNHQIPPDRSVEIRARITGTYPAANQPDAPRLLFRYHPADPYVPIPLTEERDGTWSILRKPDQVKTGFYYKVAAGDAETKEYQITVRSEPRPIRFDVAYKYREYLRRADKVQQFPEGKAMLISGERGTQVTLTVQTNRHLKEGSVVLAAAGEKLEFFGEVLKDDDQAFRVQFTLEKSGHLSVLFTSKDDEPNSRKDTYTVAVSEDGKPVVALTKPGKDIELPANGTLQVAGQASDDHGLRSLTLNMLVHDGKTKTALAAKKYRDGKDFRFGDGSYPDNLDYADIVALPDVKTVDGKGFALVERMKLEYWLEARDNSDYPDADGNRGESKHFFVTITPPKDEKKEKENRDKAKNEQKEFDKKQDDRHAKTDEARKEAAKKEAAKKDEPKGAEGADPGKEDPKKADERKKLEEEGRKLAEKLAQDREREKTPGEAKGEENNTGAESKPGEKGKEGVEPKNKAGKPESKETATPKSEGTDKKSGPSAAAKDKGDKGKDGDKSKTGEARGMGEQPPEPHAKGDDKKMGGAEKKGESKTGEGGMGMAPEKNAGAPREKGDKSTAGTGTTKTEPAAEKKTGDEPGVADAKSETPPDPRGAAKAADKTGEKGKEPATSVKGKGAPPPDAVKKGPAEAASDAAASRDRGSEARPDAPPKEPTVEDLARLREALKKRDDPKGAEGAAEELNRIAETAKDKSVREGAEQLLKKDGREPGNPGRTKAAGGPPKTEEKTAKADEEAGETRAGKPTMDDAVAKGQTEAEAKEIDPKKKETRGEGKPGHFGPDRRDLTAEELKAMERTEEFLRRGNPLQLEDLVDYLKKAGKTTEDLEKAGWTKDELARWLKAAAAHDERLARDAARTAAADPKSLKSGPGSLPSTSVRSVGAGATDTALPGGRPLPPPEFREPHRIFSQPAPKKE